MDWRSAFIISVLTLLFTFLTLFIKKLFQHLKKPQNKQINLFGKQTNNINSKEKESPEEHIKKSIDQLNKKFDERGERFDDISTKLDNLILAFSIYVNGNGVSFDTKKAVKKVLKKINRKGEK